MQHATAMPGFSSAAVEESAVPEGTRAFEDMEIWVDVSGFAADMEDMKMCDVVSMIPIQGGAHPWSDV